MRDGVICRGRDPLGAHVVGIDLSMAAEVASAYEEVFRWFESCGLRDLKVIDQPIAVQGRKAWPEESGEAFEQQEEAARCVE